MPTDNNYHFALNICTNGKIGGTFKNKLITSFTTPTKIKNNFLLASSDLIMTNTIIIMVTITYVIYYSVNV